VAGNTFDYAVIGGGLVGSCVAYGLSKESSSVAIVDEGDRAFRASRGNFGLVWVQGKGWDYPAYARWTRQAAGLWPSFASELLECTGVDVDLQQTGGLVMSLDDAEVAASHQKMEQLSIHTNGEFEYEMLGNKELKQKVPEVSNQVTGAVFCPHDGHVNPLRLFRALHQGMQQNGAEYLPRRKITSIEYSQGEFRISGNFDEIRAHKIVLCAGLQNTMLGKMVGIHIPVIANRGQLLITEKLKPFLNYPTLHVRQTTEGGLQIGDSAEDVGLDDGTTNTVMTMLAARATKIFPLLENIKVIRAWGALRVMTPDGKPVYQASESCPGAFGVACHSGVTLAAAHAGKISEWILKGRYRDQVSNFSSSRFNV